MELNRDNIKKIILILFAAIAFCIGLIHMSSVWAAIRSIAGIFTPIIVGFCIAFLLDPLTTFLQNKVFGFIIRRLGSKGKMPARVLGLVLSIIIVAGVFAILGVLVVPEVREALSIIGETLPNAITNAAISINGFMERFDIDFRIPIGGTSEWMGLLTQLRTYVNALLDEDYLSNIADTALTVVSGFTDFFLGLILSFYIIVQRDQILRFMRRFTRAYFGQRTVKRIFKVTALSNSSFRSFVTGQLTEAVIIGLLCFIGMVIFRFPYPTATSAVVGVTALIPVFGAWIGGLLGAILALSDSLSKALLFVLFLVILQQLEGDLIYPRVVGKSVGLPGILVFVAVMLGASISGVLGMLIAVPLCSIIYTLVKEAIDHRLAKKEASASTRSTEHISDEPPETPQVEPENT